MAIRSYENDFLGTQEGVQINYGKLEQQSMVHHRKYPLFLPITFTLGSRSHKM